MIEMAGVSKRYQMGEVEVWALRNVNLRVEQGEFLIILGMSGSGKSTLLNILGGMDRPTAGSVRFGEVDLAQANDRQLTRYRRHQIGFVFQFFNLVPTLTALENVQVAVELSAHPLDAREALRIVGLEERANHFPSQLSGGQQQRVAIARALAGNPPLLLCDEPTGNLDTDTSLTVFELLARANRELGKTVVLITHNRECAPIGNRVAELRDGSILAIEVNEHPKAPRDLDIF